MATVHPLVLGNAARLLGRLERPTSTIFRLLARTGLPAGEVEAIARAVPSSGRVSDTSPLSVRFADTTHGEGPLAGETVVVKDSIDVAGAYTGLGLSDGGDLAPRDAAIVTRLRDAGAVLLGKTKMTELGMDGLGAVVFEGVSLNPRAPGYFAGGSSTGTAVAVASGLARYGVGGDGMGSVRIPSSFCGLVGLKPTFGRLSHEGYSSPAPSMDVPGPMTRTAEDCVRLFQVLAGEPVEALAPLFPARVGIIDQLGPSRATQSIQRAFERVVRTIGAAPVRVDVPGAERNTLLGTAIGTSEIARSPYAKRELSAAGRLNVALGGSLDESDRRALATMRLRLREGTLRALERGVVLAMPTTAVPAPAVDHALLGGAQNAPLLLSVATYTPLANITGLPAIAIPCGLDERRRPLSIMFVGAPGSERELLRIALGIESTGLASAPV